MSDINLQTNSPQLPPEKPEKTPRRFGAFSSILLLLITLAVSVSGWYAVGKYYVWSNLDMDRINAQLEFFEQKVDVEPDIPKNHVNLGYTYFLLNNNEKAIVSFKKALELDKNYFDAYYNLGLVYNEEGQLDDALEMFQKTVELAPRDYKGHMRKGMVYRELKMYEESLKTLNEANRLNPGRADIIYEIGRVAEDQGEIEQATIIYKEALSYDPLFKEANEALTRIQK